MMDGAFQQARPEIHPDAVVHPTAHIGPGAVIEAGATIGPYCLVGPQAHVGRGAVLGARVQVGPGVRVGARCVVDAGAVLATASPGAATDGSQVPPLELEQACHVGEQTVFEAAPGLTTRVGPHSFIMARCLIEAGVQLGCAVIVTNNSVLGRAARVGDHTVLGGYSVIDPEVRVGRRVMVGALSRVHWDVPPFLLVHGVPARAYGINRVGLRRGGSGPAARDALHRAFRLLFRSGVPAREALEVLAADAETAWEVRELLEFVQERPALLERWREVQAAEEGSKPDDG